MGFAAFRAGPAQQVHGIVSTCLSLKQMIRPAIAQADAVAWQATGQYTS